MSEPTYPIQGIELPSGQTNPPVRKEVTSWINDPNNARQVSLFMRALTEFQNASPTDDPFSYYRIAGIHGNPDVSWDGVGNPPGTVDKPSWWCAHNKETFVSWHRPYLVLFEQVIYDKMLSLIQKNVPAERRKPWEDAAKEWRLPYWDWALKQPYIDNQGVPEIFTKDQIDIVDFSDNNPPTTGNIPNPLARFRNPMGVPMGDSSMREFALTGDPWSNAIATSRHGIDRSAPAGAWADGVNNWARANEAIQGGNGINSIEDQVYRLFATDISSWESFASAKSQPPTTAPDFMSLEAIHNQIHGYTGGRGTGMVGHMGDTSVAAFDPIFWFHHCNVDHLAATFQTLHPEMWYDPATDLAATKLDPFHRDTTGTTWTADATRDFKANLKYTYDDLEPPHLRRFLGAAFHPMSALRSLAARATGHPQAGPHEDLAQLRRTINEKYGAVRREIRASPHLRGRENDYVIDVIYDRYALNGASYYINFFLGTPPADTDDFLPTDTYVGSIYTFSSNLEPEDTSAGQCHDCLDQRSHGVLSTAQVPLTKAILRLAKDSNNSELQSMEAHEVERYLQRNLEWSGTVAIEDPTDHTRPTHIDMSRLPRTKISAMKGKVHYPDSDSQLATYSDYETMWRATAGKPGGAVRPEEEAAS
ncbi:common central domain of tyrosinase-domain-containing protein [Aspergillus insuetus]